MSYINFRTNTEMKALQEYLREIGRYEILTAEQELSFAREIRSTQKSIVWAAYRLDPQIVKDYVMGKLGKEAETEMRAYSRLEKRVNREIGQGNEEEAEKRLMKFIAANASLGDFYRHYQHCESVQKLSDEPAFSGTGKKPRTCSKRETKIKAEIDVYKGSFDRQISRFAEGNLRLVISIAKRYMHKGLELEDLIQAGNIGLMKGIERFEPEKGYKFSTYATWWIRHKISITLANQGRAVRVPVHLLDLRSRIGKEIGKLRLINGSRYNPDNKELAKLTGVSVKKLSKVRRISEIGAFTPSSLDKLIDPEEKGRVTFGEMTADGLTLDSEAEAINQDFLARILADLDELPEREKEIIYSRFGIGGREEETLEQISGRYGLSKERIKQLQKKIIEKLRKRSTGEF